MAPVGPSSKPLKTFTPEKNRSQRRNEAPNATITALKAEVADLKKGQNGLQTLQEIKYLKAKVKTAEEGSAKLFSQVIALRHALEKLGLPVTTVDKLASGEPVVETDLNTTLSSAALLPDQTQAA